MNTTDPITSRINAAVQTAEDAFWGAVVQAFPEAHHGDLDATITDTLREAVTRWVELNVPTRQAPKVGDRIRLAHDVDRYPHFVAPKGSTGEVVIVDGDTICARMDEHIPGCEDWDNEVVWSEEPNLDAFYRDTQPDDAE